MTVPRQHAVRILRAFNGELEALILAGDGEIRADPVMMTLTASHLAMVCEILADHLETSEKEVDVPS